jgi:hypothetical protein
MSGLDSPATLATAVVELFPSFAIELEDEEIVSYHQVIQRLTDLTP